MGADTQLVNSGKAQSPSKYGKGKRSLSHNFFQPPPPCLHPPSGPGFSNP